MHLLHLVSCPSIGRRSEVETKCATLRSSPLPPLLRLVHSRVRSTVEGSKTLNVAILSEQIQLYYNVRASYTEWITRVDLAQLHGEIHYVLCIPYLDYAVWRRTLHELIFRRSELFAVKYSVGKPIHQSIGNFTARLLLYRFVD